MKQWKIELLVIVVLIASVALVLRTLFGTSLLVSDDYEHHAARTANYYLSLKQGQVPPRWAPNLNNGFGYPAFLYTYHLPYAVATGFHVLRFSIQQSVNLTVVFCVALGVVAAYCFSRYNKLSYFLSASLGLAYMFNPYMLLNIFWRGALGEVVFYSLLPFLFLALELVIDTKLATKKNTLSVMALTGVLSLLILSHVISLTILAPVIALYVFLRIFSKKTSTATKRLQLANFFVAGALSFLLTAWYLLPAQFEKHLVQFDASKLASAYQEQFIHFWDVIAFNRAITSSEFFLQVIQLGPLILVVIASLVRAFYKQQLSQESKKYAYLWLAVLVASIFFSLFASKFLWDTFSFLTVMQFPWRFLWLSNLAVFFLVLLSVKNISIRVQWMLGAVILACSLWSVVAYAHPKGYFSRSDFEWFEATVTASSFNEFSPVGARESYDFPSKVVTIPSSELIPQIHSWNGSTMRYSVTATAAAEVVQRTLYFPGWEVVVDNEFVAVNSKNNQYPGLISFPVASGQHEVYVHFFGRTKIRMIGMYLTFSGIVLSLGLLFFHQKILQKISP